MSYTFLHVHVHVPAGGDHFCNAAEKADINSLQLLKHLLTGKKKSVIQRSYVARRMFGWNFLSTYCLYSLIPFLKESNTQLQGGVDNGADFTCTEGGGGIQRREGERKENIKWVSLRISAHHLLQSGPAVPWRVPLCPPAVLASPSTSPFLLNTAVWGVGQSHDRYEMSHDQQ